MQLIWPSLPNNQGQRVGEATWYSVQTVRQGGLLPKLCGLGESTHRAARRLISLSNPYTHPCTQKQNTIRTDYWADICGKLIMELSWDLQCYRTLRFIHANLRRRTGKSQRGVFRYDCLYETYYIPKDTFTIGGIFCAKQYLTCSFVCKCML